jgi:hypothetical protein
MIILLFRLRLSWMSALCLLAAGLTGVAAGPERLHRKGPLAVLPSAPGETIAKLKALGDNQWLVLGTPAADPSWGRARGRSWACAMAFAPGLHGAFLCGEGVHGWWNQKTGRYMDDLWFYDVLGHRWICVYPGTEVKAYRKALTEDGFEADADGRPVPVAWLGHAYEMIAYDSDARRFLGMPCAADYWDAIKGRRQFLQQQKAKLNRDRASPWMYDTVEGRWDRRRTKSVSPESSFGGTLAYLAPHKRAFFYQPGHGVHYYDPATNDWIEVKPQGPPPPFGIDSTCCYDPRRDRIYLGGGSYPVAQGDSALWIWEVKTDSWVDPKPKGKPCNGSNSYATNIAAMHYDAASDTVLVFRHTGSPPERGVFAYAPQRNEWTTVGKLPARWPRGQVNAFYDPLLNVHFFHVAGDSEDDGVVVAYRYKRASVPDVRPAAVEQQRKGVAKVRGLLQPWHSFEEAWAAEASRSSCCPPTWNSSTGG